MCFQNAFVKHVFVEHKRLKLNLDKYEAYLGSTWVQKRSLLVSLGATLGALGRS